MLPEIHGEKSRASNNFRVNENCLQMNTACIAMLLDLIHLGSPLNLDVCTFSILFHALSVSFPHLLAETLPIDADCDSSILCLMGLLLEGDGWYYGWIDLNSKVFVQIRFVDSIMLGLDLLFTFA